jgi:hypothetical protein
VLGLELNIIDSIPNIVFFVGLFSFIFVTVSFYIVKSIDYGAEVPEVCSLTVFPALYLMSVLFVGCFFDEVFDYCFRVDV